jgi:hypothetical protein
LLAGSADADCIAERSSVTEHKVEFSLVCSHHNCARCFTLESDFFARGGGLCRDIKKCCGGNRRGADQSLLEHVNGHSKPLK